MFLILFTENFIIHTCISCKWRNLLCNDFIIGWIHYCHLLSEINEALALLKTFQAFFWISTLHIHKRITVIFSIGNLSCWLSFCFLFFVFSEFWFWYENGCAEQNLLRPAFPFFDITDCPIIILFNDRLYCRALMLALAPL